MNRVKLAAIAMILAGVLVLACGSFSVTKASHGATLGPLTMSVQEKPTVNLPAWAGAAAIASAAAPLVLGGKRG